jgi:hypothetical protein
MRDGTAQDVSRYGSFVEAGGGSKSLRRPLGIDYSVTGLSEMSQSLPLNTEM